ncbi:MAG: lipoate--protein ligase family protein [Planctomycetota bacterium]|nr:lipoate--protein ligase family protein [Planctomycetota bacterium]MDA1252254.1 lipoate--protein ligase family protein [Planctomycetota bacterium]
MTAASKTRLIVEGTGSTGSWNMAVDEHLLLRALNANELAIRIYSWETPTISLGYFQDSAEFLETGRFATLPVVRRLSGGGAILHDREITYSISVPATHPLIADPVRLYEAAHAGIIRALKPAGVHLVPRGENHKHEQEPFLCFSRGDRNDLVLNGVKVVGSAQRRRKGAVLQHGSILLEASPHAEGLPGIRNLVPSFQPESSLPHAIGEAIVQEVASAGGTLDPDSAIAETAFSDVELIEVRDIEESHYSHLDQLRPRSAGRNSQ